jgi:hypothetical protein
VHAGVLQQPGKLEQLPEEAATRRSGIDALSRNTLLCGRPMFAVRARAHERVRRMPKSYAAPRREYPKGSVSHFARLQLRAQVPLQLQRGETLVDGLLSLAQR